MFRKSKSKQNLHQGSRESLDSNSLSQTSSSENLSSSREVVIEGKSGSLNRIVQFTVGYLGFIPEINLSQNHKPDIEIVMIEKLEEAQINGTVTIVAREEDMVNLVISKHGIKLVEPNSEVVLQRHHLQSIAQMVHYQDGLGKSNLALRISQVGKTLSSCYLFQCKSDDQARRISAILNTLFENIIHKFRK